MSETIYTLSDDDVAAINRARTVIAQQFKRFGSTHTDGLLYAKADSAGDALFDLLNCCQAYGDMPLTQEQVHNRLFDVVS